MHLSESLNNFAAKITPFGMKKITFDAPLLSHNTFGMNVKAAVLAEYETVSELREILADPIIADLMLAEKDKGHLPFWHIGSGSNLLFTGDYPGVVLHSLAKGISRITNDDVSADNTDGVCLLKVEAGTLWDDVCAYCSENGLYGPENLSLIPGEMGAAAVQNIGAYGVEISKLIEEVICWDVEADKEHRFRCDEMGYGYRESRLKHAADKARFIVTSVILRVQRARKLHLEYAGIKRALGIENVSEADLAASNSPNLQEVRDAVIRIREGKLPDPKVIGNAGSFFKNPVVDNSVFYPILAQYPDMPHYVIDADHTKIPAGWMIEQCGWKGKDLGRAGVYEKQSLVLVNRGGAKPEEIVRLCQNIIDDVEKKFGIRIEPEVNLIEGR